MKTRNTFLEQPLVSLVMSFPRTRTSLLALGALTCTLLASGGVAAQPAEPTKPGAQTPQQPAAEKKPAQAAPGEAAPIKKAPQASAPEAASGAPEAASGDTETAPSGQADPKPDSAEASAEGGAASDPSWRVEDEAAAQWGPGPGETSEESPQKTKEGSSDAAATSEEEEKRYVLPSVQRRPLDPPPPEPDYNRVPFTHHQLRWDIQMGARVSFISSEALDPFSENDALTQVSLGFGRGIVRSGRWSVAALGLWELGSTSASIRGMSSKYSAQRFALALEGRYHVWHWFYGYGRLAPGALRTVAVVESPGVPFDYEATTWVVSADAALGAAARLFGSADGRQRGGRFWLFAEGGYGWSATQDLALSPTAGAPDRARSLELAELSLAGPFVRVGGTVSF